MTPNKQKKSPFLSRTVWMGLLSIGAAILVLLADQTFVEPRTQAVLMFVSGTLTIVFRQLASVQTLPFKELLKK